MGIQAAIAEAEAADLPMMCPSAGKMLAAQMAYPSLPWRGLSAIIVTVAVAVQVHLESGWYAILRDTTSRIRMH